MEMEFPRPGMENQGEAQGDAQPGAGQLQERLARAAEQGVVDLPRMPTSQGPKVFRQGEHPVEMRDGQNGRSPGRDPAFLGEGLAFRAVPVPAGIVARVLL